MRLNPVFVGLVEQVGAFLATRGYTRTGNVFRANRSEVVLVIELQKSETIFRGRLAVTVNLGVCSKEVSAKMDETPAEARPADCHWEERMGFLMPIRDDKWWPISDAAERDRAVQEIVDGLERFGLPALEAVSSTAGLRAHWESGASRGRSDGQREWYLRLIGGRKQ